MPWVDYTLRYTLWTLALWAGFAALVPILGVIGEIALLPYLLILFRFAPFFAMLILANHFARTQEDPPGFSDTITLAFVGAIAVAGISALGYACFNLGTWLALRIMDGAAPDAPALVLAYDRTLLQHSAIIAFLSIGILFQMRTRRLIAIRKSFG